MFCWQFWKYTHVSASILRNNLQKIWFANTHCCCGKIQILNPLATVWVGWKILHDVAGNQTWNLCCYPLLDGRPCSLLFNHSGRFFSFFRVFGLFLSSNILVCISLDRFYAIIWPIEATTNAARNVKILLWSAWTISILSAIPQVSKGHFFLVDVSLPKVIAS